MAEPDLVQGTYVNILVESPATADGSGTYVPLCGLETRTLTEQVNTRDRFTRDCADAGSVPIRRLVKTGKQWDLAGAGGYNRAQGSLVSSLIGEKRFYRFAIGEPADDTVYQSYFWGPAMLTQRQITGADDDDVQAEMTFASDGEWAEVEV